MQRAERHDRLYLLQSPCLGVIFIKIITKLKEFYMEFGFNHIFHNTSPASAAVTCCVALCLVFLSPTRSSADNLQKFDLDINELKQRSSSKAASSTLPPVSKKRTLPAKGGQKQGVVLSAKKTVKSKHGSRSHHDLSNTEKAVVNTLSQEKLQLLKTLPSPGFIPTPSQPKTVKLQASIPPCKLIPKILVDFLSPVPVAETQKDVRTEILHTVQGNMITAAIACDLAVTEEKTLSRQLAEHGTRLVNITAGDSPETVVNKIAGALGYSTQTVRATLDNARLVYVFPSGAKKENGIFFSIADTNETATVEKQGPATAVK